MEAKLIKAIFKERIKRTSTVESFRFVPEEKIEFVPGQFLRIIFDEHNLGNKELNKYLSFSSSPTHEYIEVTKRLSDSIFSQKLRGLTAKESCFIKGPLGNCVFKDDYKKVGFIIGGIGITPVISMFEYIVKRKLNTDVILFYSNRREEDIAFKDKLDEFQKFYPNKKLSILLLMSNPQGRSVYLDA